MSSDGLDKVAVPADPVVPHPAGDVDGPLARPRLEGGLLGAPRITFMVLAACAPIGGAVALLPLALALGVGVGTPGLYVVAAVTMALFGVGFTRMVPYVTNSGAFFAYITQGIGRPAGLAAAYVALVAYIAIEAAVAGSFGFFASQGIERLTGWPCPWWLVAGVGLGLVMLASFRRISVAASVLGVALVVEALFLLVLDIGILVNAGSGAFSFDSFHLSAVFSSGGSLGAGIVFAFSCFFGFESTAIYAEEARDPRRSVPRATYAAVVILGLLFVCTSWALVAGGGGAESPQLALSDPGNYVYGMSDTYVTHVWTILLEILVITSSLVAMLSFHNAASRYLFSLGRDGMLPRSLARLHPRYQSPTYASVTCFTVTGVIAAAFAIGGRDPLTGLVSSMTGIGGVALLGLMAVTALAVLVFFSRRRQFSWALTIAPALAALGLGWATFTALTNFSALTGTSSAVVNNLWWIVLVAAVIGVGVALHARSSRPEVYAVMGGTVDD